MKTYVIAMNWVLQSPDANPIKNVWATMNVRLIEYLYHGAINL